MQSIGSKYDIPKGKWISLSFYDSKGNRLYPVLRYVKDLDYALKWAETSRNYRGWKYCNVWYDNIIIDKLVHT